MPTVINGLPAHVLLVHVVVVFVPLAALFTVLAAVWPAARRKLGVLTPAAAAVALVSVPFATSAGEWLQNRLREIGNTNPAIAHHAELGHRMLPFAVGLFVMAVVVWAVGRREDRLAEAERNGSASPRPALLVKAADTGATAVLQRPRIGLPTWVGVLVTVVAVAVSVASVYWVYRVGDSGARAVWQGLTGS